MKDAGSKAKIATFDLNKDLIGASSRAPSSSPSTSSPTCRATWPSTPLWLYKNNGNVIGGGRPVLTGPAFVDKSNVGRESPQFAAEGTR